jgi:hypothetical protein
VIVRRKTDSFVNVRAVVGFGPSFIFRRFTIPADRLINSTVSARPSVLPFGEALS